MAPPPAPELPALETGSLSTGARKIVLVDAELPGPSELAAEIAAAHAQERIVAIHCVTRAELALAIAALEAAGVLAGDRIEHASVAPPDTVEQLASLGVAVVTQPGFLRERGDAYRTDVEPRDQPWLYRCRGFLEAGVALGGGTDAPFGDLDPWLAMRAADIDLDQAMATVRRAETRLRVARRRQRREGGPSSQEPRL